MAAEDLKVSEAAAAEDLDRDAGIEIHIDLRDKAWKKGLLVTAIMFVAGVLILAAGICTKSLAGVIVGAVSTAMFGFFTYISADPSQHVSMQMVKGELSYRQLQAAIASERFKRPIPFLRGTGKPTLFLVSENWVILGDKIGTPVYLPKTKVSSIEVRSDLLDIEDHESWDGQAHQAPYCYFRFHCDEKHIFECGAIRPASLDRALSALAEIFPPGTAAIRTKGRGAR